MLEEIIKNFPKQLDWQPEIQNSGNFGKHKKFVVCGMGGSNLAAGIIKSWTPLEATLPKARLRSPRGDLPLTGWRPKLDIIIHRDYGLPQMDEAQLKDYLVIASSYSGNTEETISAFHGAQARGLPLLVITTPPLRQTGLGAGQAGGKLLELAQEHKTPYIQMPKIDNSPRFAIGLSIKATLKAMGEESILNDISGLSKYLNPDDYEQAGRELAKKLQNKIPLIYSSGPNAGLARYWKISFNETAKLPAFYNFLPELNHNEMIGFDSKLFAGLTCEKFAFVFLDDIDDDPQIQKRMAATQKIFEDRGFTVLKADVTGPSLWHKSFASILTAMWTSYFLAQHYGVDPEDISMIEDFKKSLTS